MKKNSQENMMNQIKLVVLFGSRVDGLTHSKSDYDLLIQMKNIKYENFNYLFQLKEVFSKQLRNENVDIVFYSHADPLLLRKVIEKCKLFLGKEKDFFQFKMHAFFQYCDYQPYLAMERKVVSQKLNAY